MGRGEQTREHIVEKAAGLFNQKGYAGASMSDIMEATGLQKGGIYRHFGSKEELAAEAFAFAVRQMAQRFSAALEGKSRAVERLHSIIDVYVGVPVDPPVPGGCPVLSAAAESDFGADVLRDQVQSALEGLQKLVRDVVSAGMKKGELRPETDPAKVATVFTATLEGGILLTQLYDDPRFVRQAAEHLREYVEGSLVA